MAVPQEKICIRLLLFRSEGVDERRWVGLELGDNPNLEKVKCLYATVLPLVSQTAGGLRKQDPQKMDHSATRLVP